MIVKGDKMSLQELVMKEKPSEEAVKKAQDLEFEEYYS
jgi:hypothetical protein